MFTEEVSFKLLVSGWSKANSVPVFTIVVPDVAAFGEAWNVRLTSAPLRSWLIVHFKPSPADGVASSLTSPPVIDAAT